MIIATGDTAQMAPITGLPRAWAQPLFLHQDTGPSLTGHTCEPAPARGDGSPH